MITLTFHWGWLAGAYLLIGLLVFVAVVRDGGRGQTAVNPVLVVALGIMAGALWPLLVVALVVSFWAGYRTGRINHHGL